MTKRQTEEFIYNQGRLHELLQIIKDLLSQQQKGELRSNKMIIDSVKHLQNLVRIYETDQQMANWDTTYQLAHDGIKFSLTQPAQGTQEWLDQRKNLLSASDAGSALEKNPYKVPELVIIDKCGYPNKWWFGPNADKYCHHGHKYEFVASQIHEIDHGVKCYEASFIPHPSIKFLGASPDKFAIDEKRRRGYLVEIKCPYRRYPRLNVVPEYYWVQMQIQMEVTNLEECYFEDCRILEYYDEDTYRDDQEVKHKGIVGEVHDLIAETTHYIYPRLAIEQEETADVRDQRMKNEIQDAVKKLREQSERYHFVGYTWWKLAGHQSILVLRDRKWFTENLPKLEQFWNKVLHHREHGYDELVKQFGQPTATELGQA